MQWPTLVLRPLALGALQTFRRFPLTLLSAFIGTGTLLYLTDLTYEQRITAEHLNKIVAIAVLGLILFFNLQLFSERYLPKQSHKIVAKLLGIALLITCYLLLPDQLLSQHWIRLFLLGTGLHLIASYAPFLNCRLENGFWQYNKVLFLRLLTAALYTTVLFLGVILAITAIRELFEVSVDSDIYGQCWLVMVGVFNTWFFLAGVPVNWALLETDTTYPKGLKIFTQFVLLPLVTLYLAILYAYLGKIIILWDWPRGWVSNLVLGFSVAGIFSLLLIYPIRHQKENTWIRTYTRWFYRALFPLIILLVLAIWRRVSQYGITESRYVVLVLAGWLLIVAIYFLFSKSKNIKFIPFTLSIVVLLAAFGPWGMLAVAERSQTNRLAKLFQKYGILENGKVHRVKQPVPHSDLYQISSILTYLGEKHQYARIKPWFGAKIDSVLATNKWRTEFRNTAPEMMQTIGLAYQWSNTQDNNFQLIEYHLDSKNSADIRAYDYLLPLYSPSFYQKDKPDTTLYARDIWRLKLMTQPKENKLRVSLNGQEQIMHLSAILEKLALEKEQSLSEVKLSHTLTFKTGTVRFIFQTLQGERKQGKYQLHSLQAIVLVRVAAPTQK